MPDYSIPEDLKDLYEAAKPLKNTGLWMPDACDRVCELIERIARLEAENSCLLEDLKNADIV